MSSKNSRSTPTDVLIIGAGPAGLTAVLGLSRLLRTCIVFSSSKFRNDLAQHMHGVPTWEHRNPADFRKATREDILAHYDTASFQDVAIKNIEKTARDDGSTLFKAVDENGKEWWGRKLLLATGIKDIPLDIPGYEECWAKSIYHCLFCHGYEERGAPSAGVLAVGALATPFMILFFARFANRLAEKVVIYTNGDAEVTRNIQATLSSLNPSTKSAQNISIQPLKITKFVNGTKPGEIFIHLEDGTVKKEGFLGHKAENKLVGDWVQMLGLETTETGIIKVNPPLNETSAKGVFAAGDMAALMPAVVPALASAAPVAAGLCSQLDAED